MKGNLPLYVQLKNSIIEYIETQLKIDDLIPSEYDLMQKYSVSRTTVRKALKELKNEGIVYQKQGIGTFVKAKDNVHKLGVYSGFSKRMESEGVPITYELVSEEIIQANTAISKNLTIDKDDQVFHLERIGSHENIPVNLTYSYIPYNSVIGIENYPFDRASLYHILREHFGIQIIRTVKNIEAILTDYEKAEKLQIDEGVPILKFDGYVYASKDSGTEFLIEYFRAYYRTDNTQFSLEECANKN